MKSSFINDTGIAAHYDYAPFGAVTRAISASAVTDNTFTTDNPFRFPSPDGLGRIFSSEYHDDTLGLVYYNYRHYNPIDGRWCGRDFLNEQGQINLYDFVKTLQYDYLCLRPLEIRAINKYKATYSVIYSECKCVQGKYQWIRNEMPDTTVFYTDEIRATFVWSQKEFFVNLLKGVNDEYLQDFVKDYFNGKTTELSFALLEESYPGVGKILQRGGSIYDVVEHICKIKNIVYTIATPPEGSSDFLRNGDYYRIEPSSKGEIPEKKAFGYGFDLVGTHIEPVPCTSITKKKTYLSAKLKEEILVTQGEWF